MRLRNGIGSILGFRSMRIMIIVKWNKTLRKDWLDVRNLVLIPVFAALVCFLFSVHDAHAVSTYDIKDQTSCLALPSGSPFWTTNECIVSNISLTLNSGDSLTVESGITLTVEGGTITNNDGTITNNGVIVVDDGSLLNENDGTINNNGVLVIEGEILVGGGYASNSAVINNNSGGSIIIQGTVGFFNNFGIINNNLGAVLKVGALNIPNADVKNSGIINNSGTLSIDTTDLGFIQNNGKILNFCTGIIDHPAGILGNPVMDNCYWHKLLTLRVSLLAIQQRLGQVLSPTSACVNPLPGQLPPGSCVTALDNTTKLLRGLENNLGSIQIPPTGLNKNATAALHGIVSESSMILDLAQNAESAPGPTKDQAEKSALDNIISIATETNTRALSFLGGNLIVEKDTIGGDGTFKFDTNSTAAPSFFITTVGGVGTTTLHMPINAGLVVGEVGGPSKFAFTSISCSNVQGSNIIFLFPDSKAATFQLTSGSSVIKCTFVNTNPNP